MARIRPLRPNQGNNNNNPRNPLLDNEDLAMRANDARLADVENRLARLYGDAANNLTSQLDEYLERYAERDEAMRLRVESGEISQTEYIAWRNRVILRQHQMEQQIESLTNDMVNADRLAVQMVNGELPDVYVSSYNYSGFRGEVLADAAGYSYNSFTLYNADAIRIIVAEDPDLIPWEEPSVDIPRDMRWNRSHIQNAIAHGILTGASIPEISASLLPIVNMDRVAATRTARTSFTAVQNQARRDGVARLRANGIPMVEPWMSVLANNTRDTHLQLHGTYPNEQGLYGEGIIASGNLLRFPGDPHGDPEQIYNCQCRVQSYIEGIDHSRDAELYAQMMRQEHYDDWVGRREGYDINGVRDYKVEEQRQALERRRALNEGEIENRENRYRRRRQQRENGSVTPVASSGRANVNIGIDSDGDINLSMARMNQTEYESWNHAISNTNYRILDESERDSLTYGREQYSPGADNVSLFQNSSANTVFHETAHAVDMRCIDIETRITGRTEIIGSDEWREIPAYIDTTHGASSAVRTLYEAIDGAYDADNNALMQWAGISSFEGDSSMWALNNAIKEFGKTYGDRAATNLSDMIDAHLGGSVPLIHGCHGRQYWSDDYMNTYRETWAEISSMRAEGMDDALNEIRNILPNRTNCTEQIYEIAFNGGDEYARTNVTDIGYRISEETITIRRNPDF